MEKKQFGRRGPEQQARSSGSFTANSAYTSSTQAMSPSGLSAGDFDALDFASNASVGSPRGAIWLLFGFDGRLGRGAYWMIGIPRFIVHFVVFAVLFTKHPEILTGSLMDFGMFLFGATEGLYYLAPLVPLTVCYWSLESRRIHDRGHSALWLMLLFMPIVNLVYGVYLFVANGFFAGTPGRNEFG